VVEADVALPPRPTQDEVGGPGVDVVLRRKSSQGCARRLGVWRDPPFAAYLALPTAGCAAD